MRPNAILVPQRAVQQGAKGHFVWVVDKDGKAEQRPVMVGDWYGDRLVHQRRPATPATSWWWTAGMRLSSGRHGHRQCRRTRQGTGIRSGRRGQGAGHGTERR